MLTGACGGEDTKRYRVPGSAMEPTLRCARPAPDCSADEAAEITVRVDADYVPKRGDIVVLETPPTAEARCGIQIGEVTIKRVVGLPRERWEAREGWVYVDGERLEEPYVPPDRRDAETHPPRRVPPGQVFVLGDNRSHSCDSRVWGPVPVRDVVGPVVGIDEPG